MKSICAGDDHQDAQGGMRSLYKNTCKTILGSRLYGNRSSMRPVLGGQAEGVFAFMTLENMGCYKEGNLDAWSVSCRTSR